MFPTKQWDVNLFLFSFLELEEKVFTVRPYQNPSGALDQLRPRKNLQCDGHPGIENMNFPFNMLKYI